MERYLGGHISSTGSQTNGILDDRFEGVHNDQVNNTGDQTVSLMSREGIGMQVFKQVHQPPNSGDIDDDAPLTDDAMSYVSNALSTADASSYASTKCVCRYLTLLVGKRLN